MAGSRSQRRLDLVQPVDLADDRLHPGLARAAHGFGNAAGHQHVVVLDHRRVPQPHPVVLRPAHPGGVLFEVTQARDGLAGIEQGGMAGHRVDIAAGHGGDAREVLDGVERRTFGSEHGPGIAAQPHQVAAGGNLRPLLGQNLDLHRRVERAEERGGDRQPGHDDRIAAVHHPGKTGIGRDHAFAGHVVPATGQAKAEVLIQRGADESRKVEAGKGERRHSQRFARLHRLRNCFLTQRRKGTKRQLCTAKPSSISNRCGTG